MARVGGATVAAQLAALAVAPVLTRIYGPEHFGLFGVFLAVATTLAAIPPLGYNEAIIAAREDADADRLFAASLLGSVVLGLALSLVVWLVLTLGPAPVRILPAWTALLLAPTIVGMAATLCVQIFLAREHDWSTSSQMTLAQAGSRVTFQLGFGFLGVGAGLLLGEACMRVLTPIFALWKKRREVARRLLDQRWSDIVGAARRYGHFPLTRMPSSFLNNLGTLAAAPIISSSYGLAAAGVYTVMDQVLNVPLGFVNKTVGDVFVGHFSKLFHSDRAAAARLFLLTGVGLALLALVPAGVLWFAGPWLFKLVMGAQWEASGVLAVYMIPALAARFVVLPLSWVCSAANRPELKLIFDVVQLLSVVLVFVMASRAGVSFHDAVVQLSIALAGAYALLLLLSVWAFFRPRTERLA
ncbi:hypothetical protein CSW64_01320 [Caulobacter mirabilis]|uniref:Polysaccharide biosynthesis protein n=2 Tax=Caulobacter mirabilis TaxID=69666 RepID=A0A2D2AT08_9CAUL|nr:hypothetical protein CSW64_01320 [Caulobacter mirabilis]